MLLESIKGPSKIARYSFIGFKPYSALKAKDGTVEINKGGLRTISSRRPLEKLRELVTAYGQMPAEGLPPFQGGAMGLFSYDFVHYFEKLPKKANDDLDIPDAHFLMLDKLIAFDHLLGKAWAIVCPGADETGLGYPPASKAEWSKKFDDSLRGLEKICEAALERPGITASKPRRAPVGGIVHEMTKGKYVEIVRRAKQYIAAGDIFQANLSLRVHAPMGGSDPWGMYRTLSAINPSPFAAYADFGDYVLASSSPERLLKVSGEIVETRPIAGTRPRGKDTEEDEIMRSELLLSPKEKAEHIMLIDLERNDLGKVCDYGSVEVDELMTTEDYSHVIHIVSNVRGRLARGKDAFDTVRAAFPGGTITGVPKVRCMEIIDELEPVRRGPYTGSLGYIGFSGNTDLNIIIRTFLIKAGIAYVQAGAGIVADSDPEREYHETLKKAEALIATLSALDGQALKGPA